VDVGRDLYVTEDLDVSGNITTDGIVTATDFITLSKVADVKDSEKALDKLDNIDKWLDENKKIDYEEHYAHTTIDKKIIIGYENITVNETVCDEKGVDCELLNYTYQEPIYKYYEQDGLSMETRVAEMEKMIWELREELKIVKTETCKIKLFSWCIK